MMTKLNRLIIDFNKDVLQSKKGFHENMPLDDSNIVRQQPLAPAFHTYGIQKRNITEGGKKSTKKSHKWSWWRESEIYAKEAEKDGSEIPPSAKTRTLHLTDKHRGRMGKAVHNYLQNVSVCSFT